MICPKSQLNVTADDCESCVTNRSCYEWCFDHIVWGSNGSSEPCFSHPIGKYSGALGVLLTPITESQLPQKTKVPIPPELRWEVWERDNFNCQICGRRRNLTVDHIVPESKGGKLELDNLQTLCKSCNSRKGSSGS